MPNYNETYIKSDSVLSRFKMHEAMAEYYKDYDGYGISNEVTGKGNYLIEAIMENVLVNSPEWASAVEGYHDQYYLSRHFRYDLRTLMALYNLDMSADDPNMINYWPSANKCRAAIADASKKTKTKQGKAIRKVLPGITDAELEKVVDAWRNTFVTSTQDLKLIISEEPEDFKKAYSGAVAETTNLYTTYMRKHLASSCMRHGFSHIKPYHPAEMYASGDFKIAYLVTDGGRIAGRQLLCTHNMVAGPAYGTSEASVDMLMKNATDMGFDINRQTFDGAALKVLKDQHGELIGAYLDFNPQRAQLDDDEDVMHVTSGGNVCLEGYSGHLSRGYTQTCYGCGDRLHPDEVYTSEDGDTFCECCYDERFTNCDHSGDETPRDEIVSVRVYNYRGATVEEYWSDYSANNHAVEAVDGNMWSQNDVTYCNFDGEYIPNQDIYEAGYFDCALDGELYPIIEAVEVSGLGTCALTNVTENGGYTFNETTEEWEETNEQAA